MDKLIVKELDFVLEPTYTKISKSVNSITKELINIVGKQYSGIINDRVSKTNFVFFNKITDLKKYCEANSKNIKSLKDKKIDTKYENIMKNIESYEKNVSKISKKLSTDFINEIKDNLSENDKTYLNTHKKIDLTKLECYKLFFDEKSEKLIDGLIIYFSLEYEKKLKDKTTSISEMETIFNNREKCLKLLGIKNINVKIFDRETLNCLFDVINDYNNEYLNKINDLNLDKTKIIDSFLITEKLLNNTKNTKVSKYFLDLLKKDKKEITKMNEKIINKILKINEPEIIWAADNYSDDNNMRFLLFSPTMDFEKNDFLFVRQICRLAFNSENFNNKSVVHDNIIIGKDKYSMFSNLIIDFIAYQITKRLNENKATIINSKKNKEIIDFNDGLFLVDKFYNNYNNEIIEAFINNDNKYIVNMIGNSNFENFINIINRYYFDHRGNLLTKKERSKAVFNATIKNILNISLENMEQYQKILINKDKYSNMN